MHDAGLDNPFFPALDSLHRDFALRDNVKGWM